MSICRDLMLVAVVAGTQSFVMAQNSSTQNLPPANPPAQPQVDQRGTPPAALSGIMGVDPQAPEEDTDTTVPQIPPILGGRGITLDFRPEMERSNYLRGGFNVSAGYDDNALLDAEETMGNATYSVFPNVAISQSTARTRWSLEYAAGLTINQRLSDRNQGAHDLRFDSQFRLSPHVTLRAAEDFSLTAGIFGAASAGGIQPGPSGGNETLLTPLANRRASETLVETDYHFALNDVIGASGSFYDLHYSDSPVSGGLEDTRTAAGTAFWLHRLFPRDWGGLGYRFQRITFNPSGQTRVHSLLVHNSLRIANGFSLNTFIGPEYSDNRGMAAEGGPVTTFNDWSLAAGVEAGWQTVRTTITAGYARRVSDGGGLLGAVRLENVHAAVRREIFPGWAATFGILYGNNESLIPLSSTSATSIKSTSVSASLERNIGRSLGLQLAYAHDLRKQAGASDSSLNFDANRNQFSITLSYQWEKALGR